MKKLLTVFLTLFLGTTVLTGCNNTKSNSSIEMDKVEDIDIFNQLTEYDFLYNFILPDSNMSYNFMWEGYDLENKFGPNVEEESRLYSYLTEYYEAEDGYYALYLKDTLINDLKDTFKAYEDQESHDIKNYHFSSYTKEEIIDGKYLFAYQEYNENKRIDDINIYHVKDYKDILFEKDGYQLVFCCKSKNALIKENLSTKETINRNIILYSREELIFDDNCRKCEKYLFDTYEKFNQTLVKELFDYVGERIEVYHQSYENMEYSYYPKLGNKLSMIEKTVRADIISIDNVKYAVLPRYILDDENKIDLLDNNTDFIFDEDVFRKYKADFLKAYYKLSDKKTQFMEYGLYDYLEVLKIIK